MDKCPKCGNLPPPVGSFVVLDGVSINQPVKLFVFWVTVKLTLHLEYCPKCGYMKVVPKFG